MGASSPEGRCINISLAEILIRIVGIVFLLVGVALLLALVGINFLGLSWTIGGPLGEAIVGVLFLAAGIYLIRGGTVSL